MDKKIKKERLRSAAIVKLKYQLLSGSMDGGFKAVYSGVLKDLSLVEEEVDSYIEDNQEELRKICLGQN